MRRHLSWKKATLWTAGGLLVVFGLIQLVPYGRDHADPPVVKEPAWNSPQTRAIVKGACFDCHSNETNWWWATNIAPVSWLTYRDVRRGRAKLNFSDWQGQVGWGQIEDVLNSGRMPPSKYRFIHSSARLSDAEKRQLIDGMKATLSGGQP